MAFELNKCSEVKKGIRRSHFALKLKRKQKITPHSFCYEILSLHPLHQAVISARQGENGQKRGTKHFRGFNLHPAHVPLICWVQPVSPSHRDKAEGICSHHLPLAPFLVQKFSSSVLTCSLPEGKGWQRFYTPTTKNFRPHSNNRGSARCCPIQENNFLVLNFTFCSQVLLRDIFSFWFIKKPPMGGREKNTSQ